MNRRVGWALAAGLALSACAGLPDLAPRFQLVSPADLAVVDSLGPVPVSPAPAGTWWQDFADPQLDALIDEALTASPTLQMAQARVARARAVAGIAEGATRPALALAGEADRERFSKNYLLPPSLGGGYWNTARLAGEFSYGLDFWGRHKSRWQGAQAELQAAQAEAQASRLMLASAISQVYGALDYQFLEADLVARLATQRQEALRLTDLRVKAGLEPESARERAAAQLAAARGLQAASTERIQGLRHQLAALLGAGPDRGLAIGRPALRPVGALTLPSRLPADLIGRRPDVAALRARVQASGKYVEAARADFYPDVNLVGFAGLQSLGLTDLFQAGSLQLGVGPALHLPIFDGGRLSQQLAARHAEQDWAVAEYNQRLSDALREIADVVTRWRALDARQAEQGQATASMRQAGVHALRRYESGMTDRLGVIAAEIELINEEAREASLRAERFTAAVQLAYALGGAYATTGDDAVPNPNPNPNPNPKETR